MKQLELGLPLAQWFEVAEDPDISVNCRQEDFMANRFNLMRFYNAVIKIYRNKTDILDPAELSLLSLATAGMSLRAIGNTLTPIKSERTMQRQLHTARHKIGASSLGQCAVRLKTLGLIEPANEHPDHVDFYSPCNAEHTKICELFGQGYAMSDVSRARKIKTSTISSKLHRWGEKNGMLTGSYVTHVFAFYMARQIEA